MVAFEDSTNVSTVTLEKSSSICSKECSLILSPKEGSKKKRSCEQAKCVLVDYHSLPKFLKHNEFILSYYRSEWPLEQTILSIFSIHNETLNVWTHLIGFFIFLTLTTCTAMMVPMDATVPKTHLSAMINISHSPGLVHELILPSSSNLFQLANQSHQANQISSATATTTGTTVVESVQPTARWPFYAYLGGAMFCLLMSSACHLLSCHSEHTCYVMLRLDYAGISTLIVTSFYPLVYYPFMCQPFFLNLYIGFITVFGLATIFVSLVPVFETPECRAVRTGLFICMGVSGLVPIMHKAMVFGHRPEAMLTTGYEMVMLAFYGIGVLVYAMRVPERWRPGKFDLAGHSHQLFHVLVIAGAYTHYLAGLVYLSWRDVEGC